VDFNLPQGLVDYLAELDRFIEAEIKPLEERDDNIRFFDHRREHARTDWDNHGLPRHEWEVLLREACKRADAAGHWRFSAPKKYGGQDGSNLWMAVIRDKFAAKGLAGARVDEIADATRTSKRMIYYYFGSKEGLYLQVLENAYRGTRQSESRFHLADLDPVTALKTLVGVTYDHHRDSEDFIRLVMNENMARGAFLRQSEVIQRLNTPAIEVIRDIYERGRALRVFREGLDPVAQYPALAVRYAAPRLHPPFNAAARRRAGFSDEELAFLLAENRAAEPLVPAT
jgi:AcrR family transcriptional regulator